eukprot:Amastigsp_a683668_23.p4 type:complete len:117 gc:universal Amastigsp_a683668_23:913-563(-)
MDGARGGGLLDRSRLDAAAAVLPRIAADLAQLSPALAEHRHPAFCGRAGPKVWKLLDGQRRPGDSAALRLLERRAGHGRLPRAARRLQSLSTLRPRGQPRVHSAQARVVAMAPGRH